MVQAAGSAEHRDNAYAAEHEKLPAAAGGRRHERLYAGRAETPHRMIMKGPLT